MLLRPVSVSVSGFVPRPTTMASLGAVARISVAFCLLALVDSFVPTLQTSLPVFCAGGRVGPALGLSTSGMVAETSLSTKTVFENFIERQAGQWASERTYHYFDNPKYGTGVERSTTVFDVRPLDSEEVQEVAQANNFDTSSFDSCPGFSVSYYTEMKDRGEKIRASTNVVFVAESEKVDNLIEGFYLRSSGYEWDKPTKARFTFRKNGDMGQGELQMKTFYDEVISVDQITLLQDNTRLRKLMNFQRHTESLDEPLTDATLIGFGVEVRT